jgi:hypothetical protein
MLKDSASDYYYDSIIGKTTDFHTMIAMTKAHFETEENRQMYLTEWRETTLIKITASNPAKSKMECLQLLIAKLRKIQRGLSQAYQADHNLQDALINACRGVEECRLALFNPAPTFEGASDQLGSAIGTVARERESAQFNREPAQFNTQLEDDQAYEEVYDQHWTDRTYGGQGRGYGRGRHNQRGRGSLFSTRFYRFFCAKEKFANIGICGWIL